MHKYASNNKDTKPLREIGSYDPNEIWPFNLQLHQAKRAGTHYDLRLVDPAYGWGHSWAIPKAKWPKPGEKVLAVRTPTHSREYSLRSGEWELTGKGAGKVRSERLEPAEMVKVTKNHIRFNLYSPELEELSIIRTKKGDILYNHTSKKKQSSSNEQGVFVEFVGGKPLQVFVQVDGDVLNITPYFRDWQKHVPPSSLKNSSFKGRLFNGEEELKKVPLDVWEVRARFLDLNIKLTDVLSYKGKDVAHAPWALKEGILLEVTEKIPWLELSGKQKQAFILRSARKYIPNVFKSFNRRAASSVATDAATKLTIQQQQTQNRQKKMQKQLQAQQQQMQQWQNWRNQNFKTASPVWAPAAIGAAASMAGATVLSRIASNALDEKDKDALTLNDKQVKTLAKVMEVSPKIIYDAETSAQAVTFPWGDMEKNEANENFDLSKARGRVHLPKNPSAAVTAHELGHMKVKKDVGNTAYGVLSALHGLGTPVALTAFSAGMIRKNPTLATIGASLQGAQTIANLGDELAASIHGYDALKRQGMSKKELKKVRRQLGAAYGTYLSLIPFAVGAGVSALKLAKKVR